jgi:hypothetical protein
MKQVRLKWMVVVLLLLMQVSAFAQYDSVAVQPSDETSDEAPAEATPVADTISFRAVPDSIVENLKRDKDFEYANDPEFWKQERTRLSADDELKEREATWLDRLIQKTWFNRVIMVIMVGLLIFAVVKIALSNRMMMRRGPKQFNQQEDDADLQKEDLDKLITQAEQQANFRLAVRYRYMKALQQMDTRGIIQLDAKSTNWDYVNRMVRHPLKKQFLLLTRVYEYVWYGEFSVNEEQYQYLKTEFEQYNNSLA